MCSAWWANKCTTSGPLTLDTWGRTTHLLPQKDLIWPTIAWLRPWHDPRQHYRCTLAIHICLFHNLLLFSLKADYKTQAICIQTKTLLSLFSLGRKELMRAGKLFVVSKCHAILEYHQLFTRVCHMYCFLLTFWESCLFWSLILTFPSSKYILYPVSLHRLGQSCTWFYRAHIYWQCTSVLPLLMCTGV